MYSRTPNIRPSWDQAEVGKQKKSENKSEQQKPLLIILKYLSQQETIQHKTTIKQLRRLSTDQVSLVQRSCQASSYRLPQSKPASCSIHRAANYVSRNALIGIASNIIVLSPPNCNLQRITCREIRKQRSHQTLLCRLPRSHSEPTSHGIRRAANCVPRKSQVVIA